MNTELTLVIHALKKVQEILKEIYRKSCPSIGEVLMPSRLKEINQFCEDCAFAILSKDLSSQPPEIQRHSELILSYPQLAVGMLSRISKNADDVALGTGCLKPQYAIGNLESYFNMYCEGVSNLSRYSGFRFTYTICERYLPTVFEPVVLTKILTLLLSKLLHQSRKGGAFINLKVYDSGNCFKVEIRGNEIPQRELPEPEGSSSCGYGMGDRYLQQITPLIVDELKWTNKNEQTVATLTFPKNILTFIMLYNRIKCKSCKISEII